MKSEISTKRAEAAVAAPIVIPAVAKPSRIFRDQVTGQMVYVPVIGPYLRRLHKTHVANKTGVLGICLVERGPARRKHYLVKMGKRMKSFSLARYGRESAWRRALKVRSEWEQRERRINAVITSLRAEAA